MKLKVSNKVIAFAAITLIPLLVWHLDVKSDRSHKIEIIKSAALLGQFPAGGAAQVIGVVKPGEKVTVRRIKFTKDQRVWLVKSENGQEGWIKDNGKNIKVINGNAIP